MIDSTNSKPAHEVLSDDSSDAKDVEDQQREQQDLLSLSDPVQVSSSTIKTTFPNEMFKKEWLRTS